MAENIPQTKYEGTLRIGKMELNCAVLDDGTRVIRYTSIFTAFGRTKRGIQSDARKDMELPAFLNANNLRPFIGDDLKEVLTPFEYKTKTGAVMRGYNAIILPKLCKVYLDARSTTNPRTGKPVITKQQEPFARASEVLLLGLSNIGIIALVDEATGYQKDVNRAKDELRQLLAKFLLEEHVKWLKTFPDEFFEMIFKMKGWTWVGIAKSKRPQVLGHYINDLVYARLAPKILTELRDKNPVLPDTGTRKVKHHQYLTPDFGHPKLKEHLIGILALGRASGYNWKGFMRMIDRSYPKFGETLQLIFPDEDVFDPTVQKKKLPNFDAALKGLLSVPPPPKDKDNES